MSDRTDTLGRALTFIVRMSIDDRGAITGVVERVQTGEKQRFEDVPTLGAVIARMISPSTAALPAAPETPP